MLKSVIKSNKKISYFFASTLLLLISFPSFASIGVSTYRIYLDNNNAQENFQVINRYNVAQQCNLKLVHYKFDQTGNLLRYGPDEKPINSAQNLVRFSPRHFDIKANSRQTVRFTMRRKSNTESKEYRSHVVIDCKDKVETHELKSTADNIANISIKPQLLHNIPLVIRPGKAISATASFDNINFDKGILSFDLLRTGNRSLYGKIEVIDKNTQEIKTVSKTLTMYTETTKKNFSITLGDDYKAEDLLIKFVENVNFGGSIVLEQSVLN